jgi:hypothetical protein
MLQWLQKEKEKEGCDGFALLTYWQSLMEQQIRRHDRQQFFSHVVEEANRVSSSCGLLLALNWTSFPVESAW